MIPKDNVDASMAPKERGMPRGFPARGSTPPMLTLDPIVEDMSIPRGPRISLARRNEETRLPLRNWFDPFMNWP
jgi:hypothetical protein